MLTSGLVDDACLSFGGRSIEARSHLAVPVSFRPQDRVFVEIAVEECRRLNLSKHTPTALVWSAKLPIDQPFLDQGYLMMPLALEGKISAQDTRPLIMSAILQKERVKRYNPPNRYFGLLVAIWLLGFIGSIAAAFVIGHSLGFDSPPESVESAITLAWFATLVAGAFLLRFRNNRVQRLEADLQVANVLGKDSFSQTLEKMQNLEATVGQIRARLMLSGWPTIQQRIENLNNPSLAIQQKEIKKKDEFEDFQKKWNLNSKRTEDGSSYQQPMGLRPESVW